MKNKKQILLIKGGDSFKNKEDFYSYLINQEISLIKYPDIWSDLLKKDLGDDFDVIIPNMPSKYEADYIAWKIWFERYLELIGYELILIGHSLGGTFLLKYLSENKINKKLIKLLLVAPWVIDSDELSKLYSFEFNINNLDKILEVCSDIHLWQSKDDTIVPINNGNLIKEKLPELNYHILDDRGHFIQEKFPEIVKMIKEDIK